jgi:hypothetical protein
MTLVPDALTENVVEAAEQVLMGLSGMVCAFQLGHFAQFQGFGRQEAQGESRREKPRSTELTRRFA